MKLRRWGGGYIGFCLSVCLSPSVDMILSSHVLRNGCTDFSENLYTQYSLSEGVHLYAWNVNNMLIMRCFILICSDETLHMCTITINTGIRQDYQIKFTRMNGLYVLILHHDRYIYIPVHVWFWNIIQFVFCRFPGSQEMSQLCEI